MNCPTCGAECANTADFCPNCGSRVSQENAGVNLEKNAPQPNTSYYQEQTPPPTYTGAPVPPSGSGVSQRNLALCIILSIVTCGLYMLYWVYVITEDTKKLSGDPNATSGGVVILLGIVTCGIYMWYWMYKEGETIDRIKSSRGIPSSNSGVLYIVLAILQLSIVSYALIQNELNQLA